jgi:predicted RNA-binding protein YlxR (DUF448 family)
MDSGPARTCIGCRLVCPAAELVRLGLQADRVVTTTSSAGRGAWLHPREECLRAAVRGRAFARAFRRPVTVPPPEELMAALQAQVQP